MAQEIANIKYLKDDDVEGDSIYMAPELLSSSYFKSENDLNFSNSSHITTKADIFSLGATLLELASGMNLP